MSPPGQAVVTVRFFVGEDRENEPGQALQQDPVEHRSGAAAGRRLGGQADRDRRRADPDRDAVERSHRRSTTSRCAAIAEEVEIAAAGRAATPTASSVFGGRRAQSASFSTPRAGRAADLAARGGVGARRLERARAERAAFAPRRPRPSWSRPGRFLARRRRAAQPRRRTSSDGRAGVVCATSPTSTDGPDEAVSYGWIGFGPALRGRQPASAAASRDVVCSRRARSGRQAARAQRRRCRRVARSAARRRSSPRICRTARTSASRATTARPPTTRSMNWSRTSAGRARHRVGALITFTLGWREAIVVAIAVPITFALTLLVNYSRRLHDQPRHALRTDPRARARGGRPDRGRGEHLPPLPMRREPPPRGHPHGGERGPAADHRRDARGDRLVPADALHHRHDGSVHAADGAQRAGRDADVDGRRVHDHAVASPTSLLRADDARSRARRRRCRRGTHRFYERVSWHPY